MQTFNGLIQDYRKKNNIQEKNAIDILNTYLKEEDIFDWLLVQTGKGALNLFDFIKKNVTGEAGLERLQKKKEKLQRIKDKEELKKELEAMKKDTGFDIEEHEDKLKKEVEKKKPDKEPKKPDKELDEPVEKESGDNEEKDLVKKLKAKHIEYKKASPEDKKKIEKELKGLLSKGDEIQTKKKKDPSEKESVKKDLSSGLSKEQLKTKIKNPETGKDITLGTGLASKNPKTKKQANVIANKLKKSSKD